MEKGIHTRTEIFSQPEAWANALEVVQQAVPNLLPLLRQDFRQVIFTGCGSSYYLSLSAAALFQDLTGRIARAVSGGELLLNPSTVITGTGTGDTLLVAISRSGSTTDTVRAVEQFKQQKRGHVIAITNYGDQPLAGLLDVPLVIEKGQEESVAQTRPGILIWAVVQRLIIITSERIEIFPKPILSSLPT